MVGLGQTGATGLTDFFFFWCYVTPLLGAIISDQYLGKYNTIVYFSFVYLVGVFILFITSLPVSIEHGGALPGLIVAMIIIGLGTGGIKSNVSPLIAEQQVNPVPLPSSTATTFGFYLKRRGPDTVAPAKKFVWRRMEKESSWIQVRQFSAYLWSEKKISFLPLQIPLSSHPGGQKTDGQG